MINNFIGSLRSILKGTLPDSIPYEGNSRRRGFYKALLDKYYNQQDRYIIVDNQIYLTEDLYLLWILLIMLLIFLHWMN